MKNEFLFREAEPMPVDVINSEGNYLIDSSGKKYLDFVSGWCVGNAGWKKKELVEAVKNFKGPEYVLPGYSYERWNVLAEKIVDLIPGKNGTCFRATGGTEAVEVAMKISRAFNKRKKFLSFKYAYHGQSMACLSLVKLPQHEANFGKFSEDYMQIEAGDWEKTTEEAVRIIKSGEISAFISEPIICNLGVVLPPESFFRSVREACIENDTLFISDEVATGFGRTGKWFGFEHFNTDPDIITMAKGFSSGYAAIGATVAKKEVAECMKFDFSNYSTFGWHPLSVEVAISNIDYIKKESLVEKSAESGKYLSDKLSEFCSPEGKGLCIGFDEKNAGTEARCMQEGLLVTSLEGRVMLFPSLDVSKENIDKAVESIKKSI